MSNDIETRDKAILEAISKLRVDFDKKFHDLKNDFDKRFDAIEAKNDRVEERINNMNENVSELKGKMSVIEGRLNDLAGRVNFQGNWFLIVLTLLVSGVLTVFTKFTFFN